MGTAYDFYRRKGDREPHIYSTLTEADGTILNLTGATVEFVVYKPGKADPVIATGATIVNPATGEVRYEWSEADAADMEGLYYAYWRIILPTTRTVTVPNHKYLLLMIAR